MDLFHENEHSIESTLNSLNRISSQLTFIKEINRMYQYTDEPKFYHFISKLTKKDKKSGGHQRSRNTAAGGSLISEEEAYLKCLGESIERYFSSTYSPNKLKRYSYSELGPHYALDPQEACVISNKQLKRNSHYMFRFDNKTKFQWVEGYYLSEQVQQKILVPAQLVYFNYKLAKDERYIRLPISTGTAGGGSLSAAILRGTFEVLERDSFMISYLNKLPCKKVDLTSIRDSSILRIIDLCKRYRLNIHVFDITMDVSIPCFVSLITNKTKIGSAVTLGLKSHFNPIKAINESFEEALHARCWMRRIYEDSYLKYSKIKTNQIASTEERGMYWYKPNKIKSLGFWLNQKSIRLKNYDFNPKETSGQLLAKLLKEFSRNKLKLYYVDLTPDFLKDHQYRIVKVIVPSLYPFYVNEQYKYLGNKRLYEVPLTLGYSRTINYKLNTIPHPFL